MIIRTWTRLSHAALIAALVVASAGIGRAQRLMVAPDKPSGVYQVGDTVYWTVTWGADTPPPAAHYVLKTGGATDVGHGDLTFDKNVATVDSTFTSAGTVLLEVDWQPAGGFPRQVFGGAVAGPDQIKPAAPPPHDFKAFWSAKLKEIKKIRPNPQLTPGDSGRAGVSYWKVTLDNINGAHVQGQIARPTAGEKFPAILQLQYAGVYGLQKGWVTDFAKDGWLAMDIEAHDIPIDQPADYYRQQEAGSLHYYWNIGNDDRDKSYYLQMYLGCCQALEYLRSRPDWNGQTLVVTGQSQGGQQALALAGLRPKDMTALMVLVPAAGDVMAPDVGRAPGFPSWYFNTQGKDPQKVREASRYYDPANFAPRIKCPVLIALGLHDEKLAPPSSILAVANVITAPKELILMPNSGHEPINGSQDPYYKRMYGAWLPALVQNKPAPVNQTPQAPATPN